MSNEIIQLYVDDQKTMKGYPITHAKLVINEKGGNIEDFEREIKVRQDFFEKNLTEAESTRNNSEATRVASENTRIQNEQSRTTEEIKRQQQEGQREERYVIAETDRTQRYNQAEATRNSNASASETARSQSYSQAEATRDTRYNQAESSRNTSYWQEEAKRNQGEQNRISAETSRGNAESNRISAETSRVSAEISRNTNETSRANAETSRATAETTRVNQENTRKSQETSRVNQENIRVNEFNNIKDEFGTFETIIDSKVGSDLYVDGDIDITNPEITVELSKINDKTNELETKGIQSQGRIIELEKNIVDVTSSLAEKANGLEVVKKGYGTLNDFDEETRRVLQGLEVGQINAVLGLQNVKNSNVGYNEINHFNLNEDLLNNGYKNIKVYTSNTVSGQPYLGFMFDTKNEIENGATIKLKCLVRTSDTSLIGKNIAIKWFANNSENPTVLTGGTVITGGHWVIGMAGYQIVDMTCTTPYNSDYRYIKPFLCFRLDVVDQYCEFEVCEVELFCNDKKIEYIGSTLYEQGSQSVKSEKNIRLLTDEDYDELNNQKSRWYGKVGSFLGDSITKGTYNNGSSFVVTDEPYHTHIRNIHKMSMTNNYGSNGTHISGAYTCTDGSSNPLNCFTKRFANMDNESDLVVIFGGTNDYGHSQTAPFGSFQDREDISFYGGLHTLLKGLIEKFVGKTIVFMTPLHRLNDDVPNPTTNKTLKEYVDAIKEVCEYYGVQIIDLYSIGSMSPEIDLIKNTYINDGLHPNVEGHKFLGEKLASIFNSI